MRLGKQSVSNANLPSRGKRGRWWLLISFSVAVLACLVIVQGSALPLVSSEREDLLTHRVQLGDLVVSVMEQGTVESSNNTEIKCQVRGYSTVIEVVDGGTIVEPGDVLVRLDTKRLEDEIGKATTDAHTAKADLERTKADVANEN